VIPFFAPSCFLFEEEARGTFNAYADPLHARARRAEEAGRRLIESGEKVLASFLRISTDRYWLDFPEQPSSSL